MSKYIVTGGNSLCGKIKIQGAKNAALPILAASLLCDEKCEIHNCPDISDVKVTVEILNYLGCRATFENGTVSVNPTYTDKSDIPENLMRKMRSSVVFMGAILGKMKTAKCSYPGGCEIGSRPIDLHLKAFREMGVKVEEDGGFINCCADKFQPAKIMLTIPSVGATENIMLLACKSEGRTVIVNAAREPEIVDLQNFLNAMGAKISGAGKSSIEIEGVKKLHGVNYSVIPDRIAAATAMFALLSAGGSAEITHINTDHVDSIISVVRECGAKVECKGKSALKVQCTKRIKSPESLIQTMPYPGFPTDAQSQLMASLATADGTGVIKETIFENRFNVASELMKMGADITVLDCSAVIRGVKRLHGAPVAAPDLRGGAALVVAALGAEGITEIDNTNYIDRGYENLEKTFCTLGADIKRCEDN